jgi:hypothetical protein
VLNINELFRALFACASVLFFSISLGHCAALGASAPTKADPKMRTLSGAPIKSSVRISGHSTSQAARSLRGRALTQQEMRKNQDEAFKRVKILSKQKAMGAQRGSGPKGVDTRSPTNPTTTKGVVVNPNRAVIIGGGSAK